MRTCEVTFRTHSQPLAVNEDSKTKSKGFNSYPNKIHPFRSAIRMAPRRNSPPITSGRINEHIEMTLLTGQIELDVQ
jgi:hypothetical protein